MTYTISNGILTASFSDLGGELRSLQRDGVEYMHDGNPKYWKSIGPIMFPICGRLFGSKYTYGGKEYEMILHGFIRQQQMTVESAGDSEITFRYDSCDVSRAQYPFEFTFKVTYTLRENTLVTAFTVENRTDGVMPVAVGGHPGFRVPIEGKGEFTDCYIEFSEPCPARRLRFSPSYLRLGNDPLYGKEDLKTIELHHGLFDDDAIFLYDTAKSIAIRSRVSDRAVRVDFDGFKYVGLWHAPKTDANYVCIEPWTGSPGYEGKIDDFATKEDMTQLEAGGVFSSAYSITIE